MMWSLTKKELRDHRTSLIAYCLGAFLFLWLYVSIFPSIQDAAQQINEFLKHYPKDVMAAFGLKDVGYDTLEKYISTEHFSFIWPLLVIILMISRAGSAIAGEIERGTMGLLLAMPVSRANIFWAKYLAGIISLVSFVVISVLGIVPLILAYGIPLHLKPYMLVSGVGIIFGLTIFSVAMLFSCLTQEKSKAYFATAGILIVMYVLNVVSAIKDSLSWLKYTSIFYYENAQPVIVHNKLPWLGIGLMLVTSIAATLTALTMYKRKDISV